MFQILMSFIASQEKSLEELIYFFQLCSPMNFVVFSAPHRVSS